MLVLTAGATTCTQLESITGDGNVWIYSGVKPTCTDRVEITFKATSGNTAALYCARGNTTGTATFTAFIIQNGGDTVRLDRNTTTGGPYVKLSLTEPHTLVVDGSLQTKCTWDGNPIAGDLASGDIDCENDIEGLVLDRLVAVNGTAEHLFVLCGKGLTLSGGTFAVGKNLVLGADGRGTT